MYVQRVKWTARQVNFLAENWDKMSDEQMSVILGRTLKSVRRRRERLELKKACGRGIVRAAGPIVKKEVAPVEPPAKSSEPDGTITS